MDSSLFEPSLSDSDPFFRFDLELSEGFESLLDPPPSRDPKEFDLIFLSALLYVFQPSSTPIPASSSLLGGVDGTDDMALLPMFTAEPLQFKIGWAVGHFFLLAGDRSMTEEASRLASAGLVELVCCRAGGLLPYQCLFQFLVELLRLVYVPSQRISCLIQWTWTCDPVPPMTQNTF